MTTLICKEFLLQRYLTFNSGNSEEKINEVNEDYQKNLAEALELQTDEYKQLSVEVEKSIETKIRMDEEIASLSEEIKALESSNEQLIKEIDDIDEKYVTEETILDGEIKFLKDKIKRIHDKQTPLIESVEQLKQTLKTQSCSHQEKLTLTKAIESLTKEVKRKREKLQHAQHLQQQFNDKLHDERNKLEEKVTRWNSFLLEWAIRKPQLKSLVLNDFGFHHQSYVDNIKEVLKQKNIIENNLIKELEELDNELKNQKALNKKMELNLQELIKAVDDLTVEYTKTHQSAEQIEALLLSLAGEWENAKKAFAQEMSEISAKYDVEGSEKTLLQSRERKESLEKEVKIFGRKVLTFFIDLHKQITKDLKEMEEIRTQVMMGKMISLRNKQLEIIKKHDRL